MAFSLWLGFLVAAILIAVSPGPGAAASMSAGLRYGYGATLRVIFGLQSALIIQLAIVAVGLGALLTASTLAFDIVKFVGATYRSGWGCRNGARRRRKSTRTRLWRRPRDCSGRGCWSI